MDELERITAYHEAGHAIAAAISGGLVVHVSIVPEEDDRTGETAVQWPDQSVSEKEQALREIRVSLGGPVSEMIYCGEYDGLRIRREHAGDWKIAIRAAACVTGDQRKQTELLSREAGRLYQLFREDEVRAAIGELADQLLTHETVCSETVGAIINQWIVN